MTGTLWHKWFAEQLMSRGVFVAQEVNVSAGLPEGWSGTADGIFWDQEARGFVLGDYKTVKGEGLKWILQEGAKEEHIWQLSTYWHALYRMGLPMVKGFAVLYWPMNDTPDKDEFIYPSIQECEPLPFETVWGEMEARWELCQAYLNSMIDLYGVGARAYRELPPEGWHTEALAPEMERVQKCYWDSKAGIFNVKLVPHWSSQFCPYPTEICACSMQPKSEKIGHYSFAPDGSLPYTARDGYEGIAPNVGPSPADTMKRRNEVTRAA